MKIITAIALALAALMLPFAARAQEIAPGGGRTYADYIGADIRIAVETGDVFGEVASSVFGVTETPEFTTVSDMMEAVRMGRADAALLGHSYIKQLQDSGMYPDFEYLWIPENVYINESAPIFHTEELRDAYNEWFAGAVADGTWQETVDRWIGQPLPAQEDIPRFKFTGENGVLRVCDTGNYPPLVYIDANGEPAGFDIEMVSRFALHMGMTPEFTLMAYEGIAPYVTSGKADMSSAALAVTGEREDAILFGEPSVITQAVLIVPKEGGGSAADTARDYTWFEGKELGAIVGATHDMTIEKLGGTSVYFNGSAEAAEAVRQKRVAGFMTMLANARVMAAQMDMFEVVVMPKEFFSGQVAASSADQAVIDRFNDFLTVIKADGTLAEMETRWFSDGVDLDMPMPEIDNSGANGVIKIATSALSLPYVYMGENGVLKGFSVELAMRFGAYEEKTVEFEEMEFSALIPYINSGRAELSVSSMNITEERRQSVLFSEPFHNEQHGILALKQDLAQETTGGGFMEWLKTGFERNLLTDNRWRMLMNGLGVTMVIAFFAQILGTALGAAVCFLLTRKNRAAAGAGQFYCSLIRGLPMVVLLMITYYIIFGDTGVSNVLVAIAAFTIVTGASVAQNLKGAIDTVDPVEIEAARSMGFTAAGAFFTVTLPQAVRRALPGYTGGFVELVKATAIVGYVAIQDLMRAGDLIRSRTYDAYFPLLFVGAVYLIITTACIQIFKLAVKKINGGEAR